MKPEIKQRWIEALRSGEYSQTQEVLKNKDGYCCLGVLCDLHSKETGIKWNGGHYLNVSCLLPDEVIAWAGLDSFAPRIPFDGLNMGLPYFNDNLKYNFNQIADLIGANL